MHRRLWVEREIAAPAAEAWRVLTDVDTWPAWGPSVRAAGLDGHRFELGATGWVQTPLGVRLRFEITELSEGRSWSWSVARLHATDHRVLPRGPRRCAVGFGMSRLVAPYALVCQQALRSLDVLLTT